MNKLLIFMQMLLNDKVSGLLNNALIKLQLNFYFAVLHKAQ